MDIFSIDLTHNEITFIRQCLELPSISGRDAKFLASINSELLNAIEQMKQSENQKKTEELQKIISKEN